MLTQLSAAMRTVRSKTTRALEPRSENLCNAIKKATEKLNRTQWPRLTADAPCYLLTGFDKILLFPASWESLPGLWLRHRTQRPTITPVILQRKASELSTPSREDGQWWLQVATSPFVMSVMLRWLEGISFPFNLGHFPRKSQLLNANKSCFKNSSLHLATFRHDTTSDEQLPGRPAWFTAAADAFLNSPTASQEFSLREPNRLEIFCRYYVSHSWPVSLVPDFLNMGYQVFINNIGIIQERNRCKDNSCSSLPLLRASVRCCTLQPQGSTPAREQWFFSPAEAWLQVL